MALVLEAETAEIVKIDGRARIQLTSGLSLSFEDVLKLAEHALTSEELHEIVSVPDDVQLRLGQAAVRLDPVQRWLQYCYQHRNM